MSMVKSANFMLQRYLLFEERVRYYFDFHTVHFLFYVCNLTTNVLFFGSLLFYSAAPTCFDTRVSSSGSSSVTAESHANRMH
jgi:hypothetical protein